MLSQHTTTLTEAVICLFIINVGVAFATVLGEATVVELSQFIEESHNPLNSSYRSETVETDDDAKDLVSSYFLIKYCGAMISSLLGGKLVDIIANRKIFLISAVLPFLLFISGCMLIEYSVDKEKLRVEFINEATGDDEEKKGILKNEVTQNKESKESKETLNSSEKKTISPNNNFHNNSHNNSQNNIHNISANIHDHDQQYLDCSFEQYKIQSQKDRLENKDLFTQFLYFFSQKFVYIPIIFIIAFQATPVYDDPFFYFLTIELKFKGSFLGIINFFSNLFTMVAIVAYKLWFKDVNFKTIVTWGSIVGSLLSFNSFIIVKRINIEFGISDHFLTVFSSSMTSMVWEIVMMPMLSLACVICPKSLEGTVYSLFMSALNFGSIISNLWGAYLTKHLGITTTNFSNLPILILISNVSWLIPLPFLYCIKDSYLNPEGDNKKKKLLQQKLKADMEKNIGNVGNEVHNTSNMGSNDNNMNHSETKANNFNKVNKKNNSNNDNNDNNSNNEDKL